jgi:hypothetical protein
MDTRVFLLSALSAAGYWQASAQRRKIAKDYDQNGWKKVWRPAEAVGITGRGGGPPKKSP